MAIAPGTATNAIERIVSSGSTFTVAGAGPVGALLTLILARQGYKVNLFEARPDSRTNNIYQGKSINIALSDRGWRSKLARQG